MSLSTILNTTAVGISNADYQIALANGNIANAGDEDYSRKTAQTTAVSPFLALSSTTATRVADAYLSKATAAAASTAGHDDAVSSALQNYDASLGTVAGGDDVSSLITNFQTSLTTLASDGTSAAAKAGVVSAAGQLATTIHSLSATIQSIRTQANSDIADTVTTVNSAEDQIVALNHQIVSTTASGGDITDLEDQRDAAVQTLAGAMGVSYYTTPDNQVQVYTAGGDALVGGTANHLSYTSSSALGATATYPGGISGVMLAGKDITASLTSGKLGGLIQVRDQTMVKEQAQLDQLSSVLIAKTNAVTNAASGYPAPASLTGDTVVSAGDSFSAAGTLRVAVTDSTGKVVSSTDLDLSAYGSVGDLLSGLNSTPGVSASINANGDLSITATGSGQGVALADIGVSVAGGGTSVSGYFGLNDLFTGKTASDIGVSASLMASASGLPTAALSTASGLAAGDIGLASADSSMADQLSGALGSATRFQAAGAFSAQTVSLQSYATSFVSNAATVVSTASAQDDSSQAIYTAAKTRKDNLTTVNTDQELTMLTSYQQQYQANAQMIAMVRTMFTALMSMMAG